MPSTGPPETLGSQQTPTPASDLGAAVPLAGPAESGATAALYQGRTPEPAARRGGLGIDIAAVMTSSAATGVLGFVFWTVAARGYETAEVGRASAIITSATLIAILANFSLGSLYERFLPLAGTHTKRIVRSGTTFVAGTALGTDRLYRYLDGNPRVEMRPVEQVHPATVTAALPRFAAVNQALQVDLDGQVGAESVAGRYLGAVGGQVDFLRGAAASIGGVGIVALPSVTTRGASRIVERLDGPVTTSAADVGWVVTEHGAVDLRGLSRSERARAVRTVADPSHRPRLGDVVSTRRLTSAIT